MCLVLMMLVCCCSRFEGSFGGMVVRGLVVVSVVFGKFCGSSCFGRFLFISSIRVLWFWLIWVV